MRTDAAQGNEQVAGLGTLPVLHLRAGWWCLLLFASLGLILEALHGLKIGWYLDAGADARRLLLTLGHAHGALLGLLNVAFALALRSSGGRAFAEAESAPIASKLLLSATVLLPGGFLLGGLVTHGEAPGLSILLAPLGGLALLGAVLGAARGFAESRAAPSAGRRS